MKDELMIVDIENKNEKLINNVFKERKISICDNVNFAFKYLIENMRNYKSIFIFLTSKLLLEAEEFLSSLIQMKIHETIPIVLMTNFSNERLCNRYRLLGVKNIININQDVDNIVTDVNLTLQV